MRGYRALKKSNNLGFIRLLKNELSATPLFDSNIRLSKIFFGKEVLDAEIILRQYLVARILNASFHKRVLSSIESNNSYFYYCLPKSWQDVLVKNGLSVSKNYSNLLWIIFCLKKWAYGFSYGALYAFNSLLAITFKKSKKIKKHVYFNGLSYNNLPQLNDAKTYNIITWYLQWSKRNNEIDSICHSVRSVKNFEYKGMQIRFVGKPLLPLFNLYNTLKYIVWFFWATLISFADIFKNKPWHALILRESIFNKIAILQPSKFLAEEYMFHGWTYRPLWTYEAERKGSRIILYFYSTNNENFKTKNGYLSIDFDWRLVNWPEYLAWDDYQVNFLKRICKNISCIRKVGPIWFSDTPNTMPFIPEKSAAVFDIQPMRDSVHHSLGIPIHYYVPEFTNKFLMDISIVLNDLEIKMVHKKKRNVGKLLHPKYQRMINKLNHNFKVLNINPDTAALKIIKSCAFVISMPYTSTAIMAIYYGKPSVYYDPIGIFEDNDRAAHGVEVLTGINELRRWIRNLKIDESSL
jgi:polysaccharide biosynthesis PFTS motif protein